MTTAIDWDAITHIHASHIDAVQAVVKPTDSLVSMEQAWELMSAESGTRPRMYGLIIQDGSYQLVAIKSTHHLATLPLVAQWLSGTTFADLITRA